MCEFCDKIYESEIELDNTHFETWLKDGEVDAGFVQTKDGLMLMTVDDDDHHNHRLYDVKYCPYCGGRVDGKYSV